MLVRIEEKVNELEQGEGDRIMENRYHKLFSDLSKHKQNHHTNVKKFEVAGFFLTDFELLEKNGYVFLEKVNEPNEKGDGTIRRNYVRLAPKGFVSLEDSLNRESQEKINRELLNATIIIAVATALGIFVSIWKLVLDTESSWIKVITLVVIGGFIAALSGILAGKVAPLIFPKSTKKKKSNK